MRLIGSRATKGPYEIEMYCGGGNRPVNHWRRSPGAEAAPVAATVSNANGELVTTIDPKDVRVSENDTPATTVKVEGFNRVSKVAGADR